MAFPIKHIDWSGARKAFVERPQRPTYEELSVEFGCASGSIGRISADEGWPALRAAYLDAALQRADAGSVLLEACKSDRTIARGYSAAAIVILSRVVAAVESVDESRAAATKLDAYNTASFCLKNLADALRSAGIIGVARSLEAAGKELNGQWNPQMLQNINVVVQGLQAAASAAPGGPAVAVAPASGTGAEAAPAVDVSASPDTQK